MNEYNKNNKNNPPISWQINETPKFPRNVFQFKEYNGMKTFVVFLFLLALFSFLSLFVRESSWLDWIPIISGVVNFVTFCWRFLILTCCYCLLWLTFDRHGFYGYAMGAFTVIFGFIYIISPIDFVPDVFPVIGGLDDAAIGGLSIWLGLKSWFRAKAQDANHARVLTALQQGDREAALKLLLEDRGVYPK